MTFTKHKNDLAFLFLFASEFTFYLLILQTGIVQYHHSELSQIWMLPLGGFLGIFISVLLYQKRKWLVPILLFLQLLLCLHYANTNGIEIFLLGFISGVTAPILIAQIDYFLIGAIALGLSYLYGTYFFDVPVAQRSSIALILSLIALVASVFTEMNFKKNFESVSFYSAGTILLWLLLDDTLFEILSRDHLMHIWGEGAFTWNIMACHLIGLIAAYKMRDSKHNDIIILILFFLAYLFYTLKWQWALSTIYPFVISYYNIIILRELTKLPYVFLAIITLGLWASSGIGLFIALDGSIYIAWGIWFMLILLYAIKNRMQHISFWTRPSTL